MNESNGVLRDARKLGIPKMLILGLQHMFAMYPSHCSAPALEPCCSICARNLKYRHFLVLRLHS